MQKTSLDKFLWFVFFTNEIRYEYMTIPDNYGEFSLQFERWTHEIWRFYP